jgi:hypothetical protein
VPCSLSSLLFLLCIWRYRLVYVVVCVGFVGCCVSSQYLVGWISRYRLMGVVENMRFGDLHPPIANTISGGVRLLVRFGNCLYVARA